MIKACIFDLDGVIVDTAKYHFIAWRRLANELGFDFDETQNESLKGVGRMESLDIILSWGSIEKTAAEKQLLSEQKNNWYKELLSDMSPKDILEGVVPFLDHLDALKIPFSIGSASKNAPRILEQLKLTERFHTIIDGNKTTKSKPDPQVFQLGAAAMNVKPAECIVFEDAAKGIKAAKAGGFYAVGIGKEEALKNADLVIPNFLGWTLEAIAQTLERIDNPLHVKNDQ